MSKIQSNVQKRELKFKTVERYSDFVNKNVPLNIAGLVGMASPFLAYQYPSIGVAAALLSLPYITLKSIASFKKREEEPVLGLIENKEGNQFYINAGMVVGEHSPEGPVADIKDKSNLKCPVLLDETTIRTHGVIAGTTGSGKTVFAKSIMKQLIARIGCGFMMIEGKGDNGMFHEIYAEAVMAGREKDFFFLNFLDKHNSNTINLLELGDYETTRDVIVDFIMSGKEQDDWAEGGKNLMSAFIKPLIILRDSGLSFDVSKAHLIHTMEDMKKHSKKLSLFTLQHLLTTPKSMFEFCLAIERVYKNDGFALADTLKTYILKDGEELKEYYDIDEVEKIHESSYNVLLQQVQELGSWEDVVSKGSFDAVQKAMKSPSDSLYKLEISKGKFSDLFNTFLSDFGEIFGVEEGDINLEDVIVNGKILHCPLQGINPTIASSIGKILLSGIRSVAKKRAKSDPLVVPFVVFLDEFNSWSKGIDGFGDLLSVTRSYGLSFWIMFQSDLDKVDDGKNLEAEQILANVNTIFLLKVQSTALIERFNKSLGKVRFFEKEVKEYATSKDEGIIINNSYSEKEEDALPVDVFPKLCSGQGYVITKGGVNKFITSYLPDTTIFEESTKRNIPENLLVDKERFMNFCLDNVSIDELDILKDKPKTQKIVKKLVKKAS